MAGGKQTPRQKMINLMYLVFIAMLALNMSKEVLTAFGLMNESLVESNQTAEQRNNAFLADLSTKAKDQPEKYEEESAKAQAVAKLAEELDSHISNLKSQLLKDADPTAYEEMDKSNDLDELFFRGGKISPEGQEFLDKIEKFRVGVIQIMEGNQEIANDVNKRFKTEEVVVEGAKKSWLSYRYEGFPLIASITNLTQMQADIKATENEVLSSLLSGQLTAEVSMSNYGTLLQTPKSAYYAGEEFNGAIVLGRTDETTKPSDAELTLDGRKLVLNEDFSYDGGKVVLSVPAGNAGEHVIKGTLFFDQDGEPIPVPVEQTFSVIPKPNSAVISADKMNVLYRGVANPITVSMPGVPDNNINVSAPGLSKSGAGKYTMNVTTLQAREVTIKVVGTIGEESYPSSQTFRIKDIPAPVGTVRGESGAISMQRNALEISDIGATLPDFDFDLNLRVTGFKFKVQGQPTIQVNGSKLDGQAKAALRRAARGETVQIFDINAQLVGNSGYKLKQISPVFIELTN
ncbi:MAG TPA: gliding motility protein GldM [Salinimicrobium sp.]|nr:gliding motility protein GldM [Salinimicrobium sp.]